MTATTKLAERVGQLLKGRYRVDQMLHVGARSSVYSGIDHKAGRVAIKICDGQPDASHSGYLANAVGHPSAVNVLDTGSTEDGAYFVIMELLEATSMHELLSQHEGRLPVRLACDIADQGLELLASAHVQRIAHGALQLDKLFFMRNERLKVLGFGTPASDQAIVDDVRAFSKALAWLLAGEPVDSLRAQPRLPQRIASVIERGFATDAAQQWQSAQAMRAALQLACTTELGRPLDRTLQPLAAAKATRRPARSVWLAAAAASVVGLYLSRDVSELGQATEAGVQTDIAAALEPPRAQAKVEQAPPQQPDESPAPSALERTEESEVSGAEPKVSSDRATPRKPNRADLRTPIQRKAGISTNIAPLSPLCAQLSSARRARALSDHEAQLYSARCTKH